MNLNQRCNINKVWLIDMLVAKIHVQCWKVLLLKYCNEVQFWGSCTLLDFFTLMLHYACIEMRFRENNCTFKLVFHHSSSPSSFQTKMDRIRLSKHKVSIWESSSVHAQEPFSINNVATSERLTVDILYILCTVYIVHIASEHNLYCSPLSCDHTGCSSL